MMLIRFTIEDLCDTDNYIVLADSIEDGKRLVANEYSPEYRKEIIDSLQVVSVDNIQDKKVFCQICQSWD